MKQNSDFTQLFKNIFPFWDSLSDSHKQLLCASSSDAFFKSGEHIHSGNGCTGGVIVISGCLRVYIMGENGKEITLYRLRENDICMLSASCVLKSITFDIFIDAEEDSRCAIISPQAFEKVADENKDMKIFTLETAVSRFSDVMWVMEQVLFLSFDKRLAIFLLEEMHNSQSNILTLTQEQIARHIGSAREVVSRMLKYFSKEKILEVCRGEIKISDKKKLQKLAV